MVNENHKVFAGRAGFQLRHHRHISLGMAVLWGLHGGPLRVRGPGCYGLTDPAQRGGSLSHPPGDAPLSMGHVNLTQLLTKGYLCAGVHPMLVATNISSSAGRKGSPVLTSSLKKL